MTDTMTALAVTKLSEEARLAEMPRPRAEPGQVVVKTYYSGVSIGTEMWIASGKRSDYGEVPFINGYQATGRIVEVGEGVEQWKAGDDVVVFCRGAHAPFVAAAASLVHRLPDLRYARACSLFVGPSVGANAINQAQVNAGDTVLVVGQGLIGQSTAQLLRLRGAYVIASDIAPARLNIARQLCADWVIDASQGPVSQQLKERYEGGVDVVFESTGFEKLLDDALACTRHGGRFVFEGWYPGDVHFNFQIPHGKQLKAFFPVFIGDPPVREAVIRLICSGQLQIEPMISHTITWQEAEDVYNGLFTEERHRINALVFEWHNPEA